MMNTRSLLVVAALFFGISAQAQEQISAPQPQPMAEKTFEIGIGPALGIGLGTDNVMYLLNAAYQNDFNERFTGKIGGQLALGTSSDSARVATFGVGADLLLQEMRASYGVPFATANLGYGFARNNDDVTSEGIAAGLGAGFRFASADLALHYTVVTAEIAGAIPSVLALRLALNF